MHEQKWDAMSEKDFDAMLSGSIPELPPQEAVRGVTPWKRAMNFVLVGMALGTVTLQFWHLQYILPVIGLVLCLLGFRTLRRENGWFEACFLLAALRCVCLFPARILDTTILQPSVMTQSVGLVLAVVNTLLQFAGFFCLWRGLLAVQRKAGLPPRAGAAFALLIWYALLCALGLVQYSGWIIVLAMVAGYVLILRSIYKISKSLAEAGYAIRPAAVRVPDWGVALALAGVLVVGCAAGYLFGSSVPMDWQAAEQAEQAETAVIKAHLLELGFPEDVLRDLTAEELAACKDALRVVVDTQYDRPDSKRKMQQELSTPLRLTGIAVELAGEEERWVIIHHFLWVEDPEFFGTESLQLWPAYQIPTSGWTAAGPVTGRVLHDRDGQTYAAPYYFTGERAYPNSSSPNQSLTDFFAGFSLPRQDENRRGYLLYSMTATEAGSMISSWLGYTHQYTWRQYPATSTAWERQMASPASNFLGAFTRVQAALQFRPEETKLQP